jgi:hypothetical protein
MPHPSQDGPDACSASRSLARVVTARQDDASSAWLTDAALGQRALVMVPYAAEWRYGAAGEDMPWYPSVRLLRQRAPGAWGAVLPDVRRELLTGPRAES